MIDSDTCGDLIISHKSIVFFWTTNIKIVCCFNIVSAGNLNIFHLFVALPEFLLYAARTYIKRITLGDHRETTIPLGSGLRNAIALDFDYQQDCIYWADISLDTIKRSFLNGSGR